MNPSTTRYKNKKQTKTTQEQISDEKKTFPENSLHPSFFVSKCRDEHYSDESAGLPGFDRWLKLPFLCAFPISNGLQYCEIFDMWIYLGSCNLKWTLGFIEMHPSTVH